jgi:DNA-binding SARP family transcriptional activator
VADPRIEVGLLGGFRVSVDDREVPAGDWGRRKAADLVKMLALAPGHRLAREQAMEFLSAGSSPQSAAAGLRKAAHFARRILDAPEALVLDGKTVSLLGVHTDVDEFSRLAEEAIGSGDPALCRQAAAAHTGELLPHDRYQDWLAPHRQRVRSLYLQVLAGGEMWGRLVEEDPANETAHQQIIRRHLGEGDRSAALRQFESVRVALRDMLGSLPGEETMALYEEALSFGGRDRPTPTERARALLAWGVVHWKRHDLAEAQRIALEARALAVDAGLGREMADASELLGLIAYAQDRWPEMVTEELSATLQSAPELTPFLLDAHICMSEFALCEEDGPEIVSTVAAQILVAADHVGSRSAAALGLLLRGEAAMVQSEDPRPARADLERALQLHAASESLTGSALALERLAQIDDLTDDSDGLAAGHRRALDLAWDAPTSRHLVPFVYGGMLAGEREETIPIVAEAEGEMAQLDLCPPCAMSFRIGAARARAREGNHESAERYVTEAAKVAEMWRTGPWHAAVAETRAIVGAHAGVDPSRVQSLLESAAAGFNAASRPRETARCRRALQRLAGEH